MKTNLKSIRYVSVLSAAFVCFLLAPVVTRAQDQLLNLRDADIRAFIDDVAMLTGRVFIVDPKVQGNVTVIANSELSPDEVFQVFLSTLRVHGFTAVSTQSGALRIVPEEGAAQDSGLVGGGSGDRFVTEVFDLDNIDAQTAMGMVRPLVNQQGQAIASLDSDKLLIVDYADNLNRIRKVVRELDTDNSVIRTLALENIGAEEMAELALSLAPQIRTSESRANAALSALPLIGSNSVILKGERALLDKLIPTLQELDQAGKSRSGIRVVKLKHAKAENLLPVLQEMSGAISESDQGNNNRARLAVNQATNAIIISAAPDVQKSLEAVIRQLDVRRSQVLVEAIIVEVSDTAARELGVQYLLSGGDGSNIPFSATNFSNSAPNILAATGALVADREGILDDDALSRLQSAAIDSLVGATGFLGGFAGETNNGTLFGFILNTLEQDLDSNILSTPFVMTLDNEPANVLVGQEIPITTGETLGNDNSNPFRTVERQNVGIQLDVLPQINDGGTIKLNIRQEVSSILGPISAASTDLILQKREVETVILADDGEIIVLGGLIEEDEQISVDKIPFLGDIPVLGRVFRSEGKSKARQNLMVFLRPTIVRDEQDARDVTGRKYDFMQAEQLLKSRDNSSSLDQMIQQLTGKGPIE